MTKYIWGAEIGVDNENDLYTKYYNILSIIQAQYIIRFPRRNVYDGYPTQSDVTKCFVFPYKHD